MKVSFKPSRPWPQTTASGVTQTGPGALTGIMVTAASATPTIKIWDNIAGSGTVLVDTFTPVAGTMYNFPDASFNIGCYISISGTVSCTVLTRT